jgi:2-haloacid dehalogenase
VADIGVVLFDLDNTLSDFDWSKREAFTGLLRAEGIRNPEDYIDTFTTLADPLWDQLERGEITLATLNDERFQRLVAHTDIGIDPSRLAPAYLKWLSRTGGLIEGARELLDDLRGEVRMGLVTNGYAEVQRPRLVNFEIDGYFDVVIVSSEIGHAKPSPAFFDVAFDAFDHPDPATVLVVGDSLSSDIAGGAQAGAVTCWFNPGRTVVPTTPSTPRIDHVATHLADVAEIVRSTR